jgi:threonylcarbamoyladenosine tRNA methylthiotransferase MtaB
LTVEEEGASPGRVALQTVGCKLNRAETDSLARKFLEAGYQVVAPDQAADIYLLNTCTVTHIADHKCRKLLRLAHRRNPDALIVVTGCYAERGPVELSSIEGVGLIIGNRDKERMVEIIEDKANGHRARRRRSSIQNPPLRTRPLVKIQEGCSQPCSFCIVPRVRGPEMSRPQEEVIAEVKARVAEGYKEVVLTGSRIGRYGPGEGLRGLITHILGESDLQRLRLSSLEPSDLTPDLLRLWEDSRLCPHIHLPLQSGSDSVLERMGRAYSTAEYERAVSLARNAIPNLALTTDIMVAFPSECEERFNESYRFCERIDFAGLHIFPYSPRPGTGAVRMANTVGDGEKKRRTRLMLDLAEGSRRRFRERFLGQRMSVLWEGKKDGTWFGLTDNYLRVFLPSQEQLANELLTTNLVALHDGGLWGELTAQRVES